MTADALDKLRPNGAPRAGGAEVIRIGDVAEPDDLKSTDIPSGNPAATARAIDKLQSSAARKPSEAVLVASAHRPDFAMPAAGWAAKSGYPVLWTGRAELPSETTAAIKAHGKPRIYVLGPEDVISEAVVTQLRKLGSVERISGPDPVTNAIAFARFTDGSFGWGVTDPGHGLSFATTARPLDAAAAAPLSALGHLRPAAAHHGGPGPPAGAAGLPARHPARLRQGPGARGLQSRLADGRRGGHLRGRAVAHRHPPRDPARRHRRRLRPSPKPSSPSACARPYQVSVDDVRQLMGASTPHFALQLRNRIRTLIAGLPADDPARRLGEQEIARLERLGVTGEIRGEGFQDGQRALPSLGEDEPTPRVPADDLGRERCPEADVNELWVGKVGWSARTSIGGPVPRESDRRLRLL